ncbi:MAG: glycosyltransferase family 2 protein [Deltaproteobacteria bacterium]|nr:glycosyltransferase family 2 protein [Deltaproteobacteria bacterium]
MVSVILFASEKAREKAASAASKIMSAGNTDLIIVGDASLEGVADGVFVSASDGSSLSEATQLAIKAAKSPSVLFLSADCEFTPEMLNAWLLETSQLSSSIKYSSSQDYSDALSLSTLSGEAIVEAVQHGSSWPVGALALPAQWAAQSITASSVSYLDLAAQLIMTAANEGMEIEAFSAAIGGMDTVLTPSPEVCACILANAVNIFPIEELFPNHAWKEHSQEAAAASYQTLAAVFIRLGDLSNALDSLRLSDQFEESPRSLALRGLIAQIRGETLGAVANMVSSLQQYEARKKSEGRYIRFQPKDLEIVNTCLASGLEALNKRNNDQALDHFAKAVFNFDAFYSQLGLDSLERSEA